MKRFTAALLAVFIPLFLMAASTQIDWTQIKNKPSIPSAFWNDPGSGTLLKRTGAFTFAAALAGDITTLLGFTPANAASVWNDPGFGTLLKRTGAWTFAAASNTDVNSVLGFTPENAANKGAASGYAGLNGSSVVPTVNLPACVASGASHAAGLVPDPGASAGTTKFLREDCTFAAPVVGGVTTQNELHASRAEGTVYQNTGTNARYVTVTLNLAGSNLAGGVNVFSDSSNPPTTQIASSSQISNTNSVSFTTTFIVLPSNFYKLVAGGSTTIPIFWTEWQ